VRLEWTEPRRLPYAGINRIRFEGVISGRQATPRHCQRQHAAVGPPGQALPGL